MSAEPRRENRPTPPAERAPGDTAYAEAYAAGYGEGLRESLKELLQHASRGHTAAELRILVESRLARVDEDVEVKRRSLMLPPRRPSWGSLLRTPSAALPAPAPAPTAPPLSTNVPSFAPGTSYLFREERPQLGPKFARQVASRHDGVLWVSREDPGLPEMRVEILRPSAQVPGDTTAPLGAPGEIAGAVLRANRTAPHLLVYVDTFDYFASEFGTEPTIRFASWLGTWAGEQAGCVVVSIDPATMQERDFRRLQRAFNILS